MRILVTGATGLIGSAFCEAARGRGYEPVPVSRNKSEFNCWSPESGLPASLLDSADAVVHLAGENIGAKRWSEQQKLQIVTSRQAGTSAIAESIAAHGKHLKAFICASALGIYGDRGDELLDESSKPGKGFLAETTCAWELAANPARNAGVRVVSARFGPALSKHGGIIQRMLPFFTWYLGAKLGSGKQFMSWIGVHDAANALLTLVESGIYSGPVNVVSPNPVTNAEFTTEFAAILKRPVWLTLPEFVIKLLYGQMGEELLLGSQRVSPAKLTSGGFQFTTVRVNEAIYAALQQEN